MEMTKIARKIKFFPSKDLKKYFNNCFGTYRYFYNKTISYLNQKYNEKLDDIKLRKCFGICCHTNCNNSVLASEYGEESFINSDIFCSDHIMEKLDFETNTNFYDIRKKILIPNEYYEKIKQMEDMPDIPENIMNEALSELEKDGWQTEYPYDLRQEAISEAVDALKKCLNNKIKNKRDFNLGYKNKKNSVQIFKIPSTSINLKERYIFRNKKKTMDIRINYDNKTKKWLKKNKFKSINKTITIMKENKSYYMLCTFDVKIEEKQKQPFNTVSIDPGVRTFASIYSPDGISGKLGDNIIEPLCRLGKRIDNLQSEINKKENEKYTNKSKRRYNMKRRMNLLRTKISNTIQDLHNKTINFLCINFRNIVLPKFDVENMVKRKPKIIRKIKNKTVRNMLTLSHGKFMEKLKEYAKRTKTEIHNPTEEYTSKTCGRCGFVDYDLGSKKTHECSACNYKEDRDINGARNILIKMISEQDHRERSIPLEWDISDICKDVINMLKSEINPKICRGLSEI